jgi:hypothetical protein
VVEVAVAVKQMKLVKEQEAVAALTEGTAEAVE